MLKLTSLRFAFIAAAVKQTRDARNAHAGDRHPFPYGGRAVIRIIMVVYVKLVGQALPRAWAVGTARKMAYTVRLKCCWGVGAGLGGCRRGACPGVLFAGTTWKIDGEYLHVSMDQNLWEKLLGTTGETISPLLRSKLR